jgi:hypothetical protein
VLLFATNETSPVGVPVPGGVATTVIPTGTDDPCVILTGVLLFRVRVVVLDLVTAKFHLLTRFVTLTEPSPVASSYPVVARKPASLTMVRFVFPDVTSLKIHVLAGGTAGSTAEALQFARVSKVGEASL